MEHLNEACWDGYKQVGMKKVQGRMVPNCIPMEEGKTSRALAGLGLAAAATLGGAKRVQNLEEPYKNVKTYSEPKKDDTRKLSSYGDDIPLVPVDTTYNPTISGRLRAAITGRSPYTGRRVVSPDGKTVNVINPDNTNTPLDNPRNQRGTNPYKITGGARWGHTPVASGEGPTRYDAEEEARNKMIARGVPPSELDKDYSSAAYLGQSRLPPNAPQTRRILVGEPPILGSNGERIQPFGAYFGKKQKFIPRDRLDLRNQDTIPSFVPVPESSEPTDKGLKDIVQDLKKVGKVTRHTAFRAPGEAQKLIRRLKALQAARTEKAATVKEADVDEGKFSRLAGAAALALAAGKAGAQGHPTLGPVDAQRADSAAMMTHARNYMNAPATSDAEITALNRFGTSAKGRAGRVFTTQAQNIPQYQGPENARRRSADSTAFVDASMMSRMADLQKQKQAAIDAGNTELDRERISRDADANRVYSGATQRALDTLAGQLRPKVQEDEINEYCPRCLIEVLSGQHPEQLGEAQYQGRSVPLGKPMRGDVKKFKVFVRDPQTGNIKKVNFGDKTMKIKKSNPARRRSFRARHHCDTNPGPRTKARYWSCRKW